MGCASSSDARVAELESQLRDTKAALDEVKEAARRGGTGYPQTHDGSGLHGLLVKVNHVTLIVADAERSKAFYHGLLGAKLLNRPNFPSPGYWMWLGNVQLHLIQGAHAVTEAAHADDIPTGNVNHISFECFAFESVEQKLQLLGVPYTKVRVPEGGNVINQLFLPDPDGHYIEICDCNRFEDFVFGPKPDPVHAAKMAAEYLEGASVLGATVAAVCSLGFVENMRCQSEGELHEALGLLPRAFKILAGDDRYIDVNDWGAKLKRMGHQASDQEIKAVIARVDTESDGKLSFQEFCRLLAPHIHPARSPDALRKKFDILDRSDDGYIDADELLLMLYGLGQRVDETQLQAAMSAADTNGDSKINLDEFLRVMEKVSGIGAPHTPSALA